MAADAGRRSTFISSAVDLLVTHGFDGLDVDWEFPGPDDKVKECNVNEKIQFENYLENMLLNSFIQ